jgi:hypothetical protein
MMSLGLGYDQNEEEARLNTAAGRMKQYFGKLNNPYEAHFYLDVSTPWSGCVLPNRYQDSERDFSTWQGHQKTSDVL